MILLFDYRVLTHEVYTGVENYARSILNGLLSNNLGLSIVKPKYKNKYLSHLWTHIILPFKKGDVLFCPANMAPLFVPKNKKLIVTIHDISFLIHPNSFSRFFRYYYRFLIPFIIKRADKIITVSESSKKEIEKYYTKSIGKIEVIYLGVDEKFKVLNTVKKKKQILYVGSMNERKNFLGVLKAFELFEMENYKLIMVGNFSEVFNLDFQSLEILNNLKNNPNIEFKSNILNDELVKIYNESELFIFPSFYEGFGLPILEAMACGTPVICSNSTSLPEVGGDTTIYCNPNDINEIKEKMELLLKNKELQKEMIRKGLKRVKSFTWEKCVYKHIEIFKEVYKS